MWGSRGGVILDDEGSSAAVTSNTVLSSAPSVAASGVSTPASTLWWDGITIASNIPDKDAEATFAALVGAMTPEMVSANNDDAIWLIDGYKPVLQQLVFRQLPLMVLMLIQCTLIWVLCTTLWVPKLATFLKALKLRNRRLLI